MVAPFFDPKIGEDQNKNKGLRCNMSGISVQKYVNIKKKCLPQNQWVLVPNKDEHKSVELWFHVIIW